MSTQLIPFMFDGREVRTFAINGEPWIVASDLHKKTLARLKEQVPWLARLTDF